MVLGLLSSGYFITKYKPPPKYLFFWNVILGLLSVCSSLSYTQLGCGSNNSLIVNGSIVSCNSNCVCDGISYNPVCDRSTGTTYYSPCHAGCKTFDEKKNLYTDCTCSADVSISSTKRSTDDFLAIEKFNVESVTNRSIADREIKPTEKRVTLYEIYDEELKPNMQPHDDDTIDENELYADNSYEDSSEELLSTERAVDLAKEDTKPRKRRELPEEKIIVPGACVGDCTFDYYTFSLISMVSSLISSTGRIGNVLLNFR